MKYGAANRLQLELALYAFGLGFLIGFLSFGLGPLRFLFRRYRCVVIAEDVVFCVVSAVLTFLFLLDYNSGVIRSYLFAMEAAGFFTAKTFLKLTVKIIIKKRKKYLQRR